MHGYDVIQELESRSGGAWRPSPGSIYPTLQMLEDGGLVTSEDRDGKRVYSLTEAGKAEVEERKERRRRDGEERHRLREPVDRRPPRLTEKQEDRGDERPGVADPDPPHEVGDREAPHHRAVDPPDADALEEEHGDRDHQDGDEGEGDGEGRRPRARRPAAQHDLADPLGHRGESMTGLKNRLPDHRFSVRHR